MPCVIKESNLVEEFLQSIDYRKGIEGNEVKEVVSIMLAIIKQEIKSTQKKESRLFKKDVR